MLTTRIKRSEAIAGQIIVCLPDGQFRVVDSIAKAIAADNRWCRNKVRRERLDKLITLREWEGFDAAEIPK